MASEKEKSVSIRNFSKGTWRNIQNSVAPAGTFRLGMNYDSDVEIGTLISRKGTTIIGTQQQASARSYGLHHFIDSVGSASKVFNVLSNGANNIIHDVVDGTLDLTGDTVNLKTRFLTYLDSCLRLNGTDAPKAFNGTAWITTGGAFDLANMPTGATGAIEWRDRVYLYGFTSDPDALKYSGIADPSTRTISWTSGNGTMYFERENGGGKIKAAAKVPGYMLVFKRRSMHRWDGTSTYPEDLVNQGVPSRECICETRGMVLFLNENGIWATVGSYPKKISKPIQDFIEAIPDLNEVYSWADDNNAYWSIGTVTVDGETWSNCVLKLNLDDSSWDVRSYWHPIYFMSQYINSSEHQKIMLGDGNGNVLLLNSGYSDYYDGTSDKEIHLTFESNDIDFGVRGFVKGVDNAHVFTENTQNGLFLLKNDTRDQEWNVVAAINSLFTDVKNGTIRGRFFTAKFTDITKTGQSKFLGFDLHGVKIYSSTDL